MLRSTREQQHQKMLHDIEAKANRLHEVLQTPRASQVLQQLPPAADETLEQHMLITAGALLLEDVVDIYEQLNAAAAAAATAAAATSTAAAPGRVLGLLLRQQAARSAATLLAWLQQRPKQLQFGLLQQRQDGDGGSEQLPTAVDAWVQGCKCLDMMSSELLAVS
uniref:Uncharacterized protein n=1 Tax=Tetradesmus obliquus TaxID=3088 RepID=A0A383VIH0_TETOB